MRQLGFNQRLGLALIGGVIFCSGLVALLSNVGLQSEQGGVNWGYGAVVGLGLGLLVGARLPRD